jgi:hypothetical protein
MNIGNGPGNAWSVGKTNGSFGLDLGDKRVAKMNPDELMSKHNGQKEEAAVRLSLHLEEEKYLRAN